MPGQEVETVESVLRAAGIVFAYLFGSRAAGTDRPGSDVDVAILFDRPVGLLEREALTDRLSRFLAVDGLNDLAAFARATASFVESRDESPSL
jgi:predicted nucleotidyltransferase